jgi:hypothetical protein
MTSGIPIPAMTSIVVSVPADEAVL